jgi:hypothetical protein
LTGFFFSALTASRLRRSASIRSTTFGGSGACGATTSSPAIFASMIGAARPCTRPVVLQVQLASKVPITCFASFISSGFTFGRHGAQLLDLIDARISAS